MPIIDLNQSVDSVKSQLNALKTYIQVSKSNKELKVSLGNSQQNPLSKFATQLNQIANETKRYQRNPNSSINNLLDFLNITNGSGSKTIKYLRKKVLDVTVKIGPEIEDLIKTQTLKSLGCSYEQSYSGVDGDIFNLPNYNLSLNLNDAGTVYVPVSSLDIFANLKISPVDDVGKIYYENDNPSNSVEYIPFGGTEPFPMNKSLFELMDANNSGRFFSEIFGQPYNGISRQKLFDIQYVTENKFGEKGSFYKIVLINRKNNNGEIYNSIGEFISDYYSTISIVDTTNITSQIINYISGAIDIKSNIGVNQIENQSKFGILAQRVLGLCFDNREEIDVSGISKISELDGVDDSFFEFNDIDLRNIDINTNNIQGGIMEFQDCDNIKLPVDTNTIVNELILFNRNFKLLSDK